VKKGRLRRISGGDGSFRKAFLLFTLILSIDCFINMPFDQSKKPLNTTNVRESSSIRMDLAHSAFDVKHWGIATLSDT